MLDKVRDQDVAVYAVWLPILGIDTRASLPVATNRFSDPRVVQYWDAQAELSRSYAPVLNTNEVVWDVYFVFDRNAEWKDKPPVPVFAMDKIGLPTSRPLDGVELANEIVRLRGVTTP